MWPGTSIETLEEIKAKEGLTPRFEMTRNGAQVAKITARTQEWNVVLKRIEVFGFKSFPDRTVLEFPEGITAIVGANGCGKSNVSDAIRWVLGEQSAKSLRGDHMEDLIFSGTATRKPMGYAEVILTFDNTRKLFPIEFTEVSIGRRLFRSGESHYLLNKQECRLRDVYDLLMDSGIGRRAHSIIEQGKIDEIVLAKPEERRGLIEEAAGIAKYRSRRTEALRRLNATREGLTRVDDLISEMDRQEASLSRQARKAERFREVEGELRALEIIHAAEKTTEMDRAIERLAEQSTATKDALVSIEAELAGLGEEIERSKLSLEEARERLRESGRELNESEREASAIASQLHELRARRDDDEATIGRIEREIEHLEARIREAEAARAEAETAQTALAETLVTLEAARAEAALKQAEAESGLGDLRRERAEIVERVRELSESRARRESEIVFARRSAEELSARLDGLRRAAEARARERGELEARRSVEGEELAGLHLRRDALSTGHLSAIDRMAALERSIEERVHAIHEDEREHALSSARLAAALAKVRAVQAEFDSAAAASSLRLTPLADALAIPAELAAAFASALGDAVHGVVVDGDADALVDAARVNVVAERLRGRAVLPPARNGADAGRAVATGAPARLSPESLVSETLAFASLVSATLASSADAATADRADGLRPLASFLPGDARPSVRALLAGWLLAPGAASAAGAAASLRDGERIVTPSGDVIYPHGAIRMARADEADELGTMRALLETELRSLSERLSAARSDLQSAKADRVELAGEITSVERGLRETDARRAELQAHIKNIEMRLERLRVEDTSGEIALGEIALAEFRARSAELLSAQSVEIAASADADRIVSEIAGRLAEGEGILEEARRAVQAIDLEAGRAAERQAGRAEELRRLASWILDSHSARQRHDVMRSEAIAYRDAVAAQIVEVERRAAELTAVLEIRRARFVECETECADRESAVNQAEEMHRSLSRSRESSLEDVHVFDMEATRTRGDRNVIAERIRDRYGVDLAAGVPELVQPPLPEGTIIDARIEELREMIARMGAVNFAAEEELKGITERLGFYRTQRDDLVKAEEGLTQVVSDIDQKTVSLFQETLKAVNTNFGLLFNRLFGARADLPGAAELVLLDPENPLESGIDIIAMPPGKKPQTLSLLSGGEKALTSVALLFAVFLVRPSPFAVLDELDAPLDDANVGKYVQLLREFSQRSQFIIITHNKRTMEAADTLYGVSQTEKGISRLIGVRMEEADEVIPEAAG
jgi:chromosome segregation protein